MLSEVNRAQSKWFEQVKVSSLLKLYIVWIYNMTARTSFTDCNFLPVKRHINAKYLMSFNLHCFIRYKPQLPKFKSY